jgi:anthranilate synthase component I
VYCLAFEILNSTLLLSIEARGCVLVASSPEILTRVRKVCDPSECSDQSNCYIVLLLLTCYLSHFQGKIINRPLAGTVRRGKTEKEDEMQEQQLLSDEKQCAEHIMLVDLGRNDVGKVCYLHSFRFCTCLATRNPSDVLHCNMKAISLSSN